jgi:RTX toxin RtxA
MTFGDEQSRKDVNLPEAKGQIREMGNAKAITVRASAAEVMKGHFFSPADSLEPGKPDISKPVVLLLTGTAGCAEVQGRELAEMYSHGAPQANVLSVNYRGFGESDGGLPSRQSVYEDGHAMFNELLNMGFKPEQIVVHGYSMGATVAAKIQESAQRQGMRLKAVVLDRPMTSVFEAAKAHTGGGFVGSAAGKVARWGVGAMDCLAKVKGLEPESAPPMLVTYDAETLGPGSQRLGETVRERLGSDKVRVKSTDAEHLDNAQTILHLRQDYKRLLA